MESFEKDSSLVRGNLTRIIPFLWGVELPLSCVKLLPLTRLHCRLKCSTAAELHIADVKHYYLYWGNSDSCHKLSTNCQVTLSIPLFTFLCARGMVQASSKVKGKV